MDEHKKMTAPESSVAADAEQSPSIIDTTIIPENAQECKMPDETFSQMQIDLLRMLDPSFLPA